MTHLLTLLSFYAALVAQVALRYGGAAGWTPNLVLLVGLTAAAGIRGGVAWAAAAGLVCDSLTGRPLGVTMLVATLAAATRLPSPAFKAKSPMRAAVETFVVVAVVESVSRCLAATVAANPDFGAESSAGIRVACTTAGTALALTTGRRIIASLASVAGDRVSSTPFASSRR